MQFGCMYIIAKKVYEKIRKRGERGIVWAVEKKCKEWRKRRE